MNPKHCEIAYPEISLNPRYPAKCLKLVEPKISYLDNLLNPGYPPRDLAEFWISQRSYLTQDILPRDVIEPKIS